MAVVSIARTEISHPPGAFWREPSFWDRRLHCLRTSADPWDARHIPPSGRLIHARDEFRCEFSEQHSLLSEVRVDARASMLDEELMDGSVAIFEPGPFCGVEYNGMQSRVFFRRQGLSIPVWESVASAAAPTQHSSPLGHWMAFHHNLREDTGEPDLTRWIETRFVARDSNVILMPSAPMAGRDRDQIGEDQGFEFPTLITSDDGTLHVFGRGSHRFYVQTLGADGWSERLPIGEPGWGCRGRRIALTMIEEPGIVRTARRERTGLVIEDFALENRGAPQLVPAALAAKVQVAVPRLAPVVHQGLQWLFGDIHQHSAHSDGTGTAREVYRRARYELGHDFAALSDHESFLGKRIFDGEWAYLKSIADHENEPEVFTTLHAYEWTGKAYPGPGHKVVYPLHDDAPLVSRDDVPTGLGLREALRGHAIAVPHHVGWTGADEDAHDEVFQPVFEVCSCHGCYMSADHPLGGRGSLQDQTIEALLRRGKRFGFIACSDGHGLLWHHGTARKRNPYKTGLTAVLARSNTRAEILAALQARRCYATSGERINIALTSESEQNLMGQCASLGTRVVGSAKVDVPQATSKVVRLLLIDAFGERAVDADLSAQELRIEGEIRGDWTYLRAECDDGEMAWSSPVFAE